MTLKLFCRQTRLSKNGKWKTKIKHEYLNVPKYQHGKIPRVSAKKEVHFSIAKCSKSMKLILPVEIAFEKEVTADSHHIGKGLSRK